MSGEIKEALPTGESGKGHTPSLPGAGFQSHMLQTWRLQDAVLCGLDEDLISEQNIFVLSADTLDWTDAK